MWPLKQSVERMIPERWELGRVLTKLTMMHGHRSSPNYLQFDLGRISTSYNTQLNYLNVFVDHIPTGRYLNDGDRVVPETPFLDSVQDNDKRVREALKLLNEDYLLDRLALES